MAQWQKNKWRENENKNLRSPYSMSYAYPFYFYFQLGISRSAQLFLFLIQFKTIIHTEIRGFPINYLFTIWPHKSNPDHFFWKQTHQQTWLILTLMSCSYQLSRYSFGIKTHTFLGGLMNLMHFSAHDDIITNMERDHNKNVRVALLFFWVAPEVVFRSVYAYLESWLINFTIRSKVNLHV